ncbi:FecR family protein, partial [Bowmanella yangjiangensis]
EEGRVGVRGLHDELLLTPGQQVLVRNGQLGSPERVDARALNGWIDGRVVFDRTPLVEVLDTLRRQRDTRVQLDDPDLAQLPVSGTFASANLDALLVLLPKILPVQLQRAADGSLSLSRRAAEK